MCLAVPGKLVEILDPEPLTRTGTVVFGGIRKSINLAFCPEAQPGDYVMVHVGFAISIVDEAEAERVYAYLEEIDELDLEEESP